MSYKKNPIWISLIERRKKDIWRLSVNWSKVNILIKIKGYSYAKTRNLDMKLVMIWSVADPQRNLSYETVLREKTCIIFWRITHENENQFLWLTTNFQLCLYLSVFFEKYLKNKGQFFVLFSFLFLLNLCFQGIERKSQQGKN